MQSSIVYANWCIAALLVSCNNRFHLSSLYGTFYLQSCYRRPHERKGRSPSPTVWFAHLWQCDAVSGTIDDSRATIVAAGSSAGADLVSVFSDHHGPYSWGCVVGPEDIDSSATDVDTSTVSTNISPPANSQAASSQPHSFSSPDVSPTVGARPAATVSYPPADYRRLRQQNTEYKFLLWWCLHHLKSLPTPPPSAGGELDLALRRVLQQTAMTPQFDENSSFEDVVAKFHNMHVHNVTKFP